VSRRILTPTITAPLFAAHYLGDYEAIILEPNWGSLTGLSSLPSPGYQFEWDEPAVRGVIVSLERRAAELDSFLRGGGILIVKLQPEASLYSTNQFSGTETLRVTSLSWVISKVPQLWLIAHAGHSPFVTGSGREMIIRELDHPFEGAIRAATGYSALVSNRVLKMEGCVLLATTRIGDPLAFEIPVGTGNVFLLPSGVDDAQLEGALDELLAERERYRQTWVLPQEVGLQEAEDALRADARSKIADLAVQRKAIADLRVSVMSGNVNLARAIDYYESGTAATRPIDRAMQDLHKLVDLLEDYFGGSEDGLATGLGVPKSRFKYIKKLANQPQLDFRHAKSGDTEGPDAAQIQLARDDALVLVQRFVEHCYSEELGRRSKLD